MMTLRIKYNITLLFSPPGRKQRADNPGPGVFGSVAPCTRSRCGAMAAIPQWLPSGGQEYNPLWSGHFRCQGEYEHGLVRIVVAIPSGRGFWAGKDEGHQGEERVSDWLR